MWWLVAFLYVSGAASLALLVVGETGRFPKRQWRFLIGVVCWPAAIWLGLIAAIMDRDG